MDGQGRGGLTFVRWRVAERDLDIDAVFAVREADVEGRRLVPYAVSISHNGEFMLH